MRAVVVAVGDELLSGLVVNTNAAVIGELLLASGINVVRSVAVGDDEDDIVDALRDAVSRAGVVIVTGGLGPTADDRTREAIARLLGTELERDTDALASLRERFAAFGRPMPPSNERQADVPRGAVLIPNEWGTAPGVRAEVGNTAVYAIPGVPSEARRMLAERVIPDLAAHREGVGVIRTREFRVCGVAEAELGERFDDLFEQDNPRLACLPGGGEVRLRFIATGATEGECATLLEGARREVADRCGDAFYGEGDDSLEFVVGRMLAARGTCLAVAESCTGGLVASRMSRAPGASDYFCGGMVTYMTRVKEDNLGVDASLLDEPVSEDVARAMASRARELFDADYGLSVTCAAGPEPQGSVDVGTTFLGLATPDDAYVTGLKLPGDRDQVRLFASTFALNMLRLRLVHEG